ncbi:MAG: ABC transporter substrate-binding protein [Rhodospirillales bacterium]|jgi:NitT/TauT family transport system substrate-binding protein|nr:ABC transporter substrate-binding protein [Rhodospirillales bacterium]
MAKINIIVSRHSAFYSPLISTISGGFLAAEGLEANYQAATPDRTAWQALSDGSADVAQIAVSASWGPLAKGETPELMHFSQINERDGFFIAARQPDPDFAWNKMQGRDVLVDHLGQPLAMFKYAAHKQGLAYGSLNAINAGEPDEMEQAFRDGKGDYVHLQGPAPQQLEKDGLGYVVAAVGDAIGPVAFSSLTASREWLGTDAALAFMRAYRKARAYVNATPAMEIAKAEADFFKGIDPDVLAATIETYQGLGCWAPEVEISPAAYETALDVFLHAGVISQRFPYDAVVTTPPDAT